MIKPIGEYVTVREVEKQLEDSFNIAPEKHYELRCEMESEDVNGVLKLHYPGEKVLINPSKIIYEKEGLIFIKKEDVLGVYDKK